MLALVGGSKGAFRAGAADSSLIETWNLSANGNLINSNSGGVIIGTGVSHTPSGYRLYVADGILTEKVKVAVKNTSEWSDKVFEPDYGLKSLHEVEEYINVHKHLPGVPSAPEMVKQGNDLHQTDARLLEKIEELTLYSIQLEKDNLAQKEEFRKTTREQQIRIDKLEQLVKKLLEKK